VTALSMKGRNYQSSHSGFRPTSHKKQGFHAAASRIKTDAGERTIPLNPGAWAAILE
jgi:hypothetical protein